MESDYQREVSHRKIEILYQHAGTAIVGMLFMSVVAVAFLYLVVWPAGEDADLLLVWLTMFLLVSVIRLYGIALYHNNKTTSEQSTYWLYAYLAGVVVSGILWGLLFLYLTSFLDPVHTNFIVFFMEGMIAAAVATYATSFLTFAVASITLLCPVTIYFLLHPDPLTNYLGYMLIIYLGFLLVISRQLNKTLSKHLAHEFYVHKLERERNYAAMINRELEEEIIKRIDTEGKLKSEIYRAEALADKLIAISSRDGLTGICNRRRFDEYLQNEWNRLARTSSKLSLILCDIDNYKAFNDTYGHLAGDDCLKKIAGVLEHYTRRAGDMTARYGGEEFVVLLPETGLVSALKIAEEIRLAVEDLQVVHETSNVSPYVSISLGVATVIPNRHEDPETLIKLADEALYEAKHGGRNRVMAAGKDNSDSDAKLES